MNWKNCACLCFAISGMSFAIGVYLERESCREEQELITRQRRETSNLRFTNDPVRDRALELVRRTGEALLRTNIEPNTLTVWNNTTNSYGIVPLDYYRKLEQRVSELERLLREEQARRLGYRDLLFRTNGLGPTNTWLIQVWTNNATNQIMYAPHSWLHNDLTNGGRK